MVRRATDSKETATQKPAHDPRLTFPTPQLLSRLQFSLPTLSIFQFHHHNSGKINQSGPPPITYISRHVSYDFSPIIFSLLTLSVFYCYQRRTHTCMCIRILLMYIPRLFAKLKYNILSSPSQNLFLYIQ